MTFSQPIRSRYKTSSVGILLIGGALITYFGWHLISISLEPDYPQVQAVAFGAVFGLLGIVSLCSLLMLEKLELDNEKLVIKWLPGFTKKIIYLSEITGYTQIEKKNKAGRFTELIIYTASTKYKLSSLMLSNYYMFEIRLTAGKKRDVFKEQLWQFKNMNYFGIAFIVTGSLLAGGMVRLYIKGYTPVGRAELATFTATLSDNPVLSDRRNSRHVTIKIDGYQEFIFQLNGESYYAADSRTFAETAKKGDTVVMDILKREYAIKMAEILEPGFWDKTVNYNLIDLYGLSSNNKSYLTFHDINKKRYNDYRSPARWLFFIIGVGIAGAGVFILIRNRKEKPV